MRKFHHFLLLCLAGFFTLIPAVAQAVPPVEITHNYENHANIAVDETKLSNLMVDVSGGNLWVVTVNDLDGMSARKWTETAFSKSNLGSGDGLLVISVSTSELYGYSPDGTIKNLLNKATSSDVLKEFSDENWEDGLKLFASHVAELRDGSSVTSSRSSFSIWIILIPGAAIAVVVIVWAYYRRKKQDAKKNEQEIELGKRANAALLSADDDLRSGNMELEFAKAEFGVNATQKFEDALAQAQSDISQAFALQRLLGDDQPETPEQQHTMNTQILSYAQHAQEILNEQAKHFNELRDLVNRLDTKIPELETREKEMRAQLPLLADKITALGHSFTQGSLASLTDHPAQISTLLDAAQKNLEHARELQHAENKNQAVEYVRIVEGTLEQVSSLLAEIDDAPQRIAQAREQLKQTIADISIDISDAQQLGAGNPLIAQLQEEATNLVTSYRDTENIDAIAANEKLLQAEGNLDQALAGVRTNRARQDQQSQKLERLRNQISQTLAGLDQEITRYRSEVSGATRTLFNRSTLAVRSIDQNSDIDQQLYAYNQVLQLTRATQNSLKNDLEAVRQSPSNSLGWSILAGVAQAVVSGALSGGYSRSSFNSSGGFGPGGGFGSGGGSSSGGGFGSGGGGFGKGF